MPKIISVISGKGGTGKSTVSGGIAVSLAKTNKKVLLIDLDIGLRALDIMLGLENSVVFDIGDVFLGNCDVKSALTTYTTHSSLKLLCSPSSIGTEFDINALILLITETKSDFDYIILDLPAGLGLSVILTKALADLSLIVTTTDTVTIRDSRKVCDVISKDCKVPLKLVINKVSKLSIKTGGITDLDEIMDAIGVPLIGVLKEDKWIGAFLSCNVNDKKANPHTIKAFTAIAKRINGDYIPLVIQSI